jgi:hypothetical protein
MQNREVTWWQPCAKLPGNDGTAMHSLFTSAFEEEKSREDLNHESHRQGNLAKYHER